MTPIQTRQDASILLNLIPEIGPLRHRNLHAHFSDLRGVFDCTLTQLKEVDGISDVLSRAIVSAGHDLAKLEQEKALAKEHGIDIITFHDDTYPAMLRALPDAPPVIYARGNIALTNDCCVALVGSRRPTFYGEKVAAQLSKDLSALGIVTVSGLARGIDTVVHHSTLQVKGGTIAVMGSGILKMYPPENKKLAEQIAEHGLILSEFPLHFPPDAGNFPRRNRLISGLSLGTVVVEAAEKSGALITAKYALEQGKDVFAVPGTITSRMSDGPNILIQNGAKLVRNVKDILEEIEPLKDLVARLVSGNARKPAPAPVLEGFEQNLFDLIPGEPIHIDTISTKSSLPTGTVSQALLGLEMKGLIRAVPGNRYARN